MELRIGQYCDGFYYIELSSKDGKFKHTGVNPNVANYLGIDEQEHIKIFKQHNYHPMGYFISKNDAESVLKILEPYLIMKELTK